MLFQTFSKPHTWYWLWPHATGFFACRTAGAAGRRHKLLKTYRFAAFRFSHLFVNSAHRARIGYTASVSSPQKRIFTAFQTVIVSCNTHLPNKTPSSKARSTCCFSLSSATSWIFTTFPSHASSTISWRISTVAKRLTSSFRASLFCLCPRSCASRPRCCCRVRK